VTHRGWIYPFISQMVFPEVYLFRLAASVLLSAVFFCPRGVSMMCFIVFFFHFTPIPLLSHFISTCRSLLYQRPFALLPTDFTFCWVRTLCFLRLCCLCVFFSVFFFFFFFFLLRLDNLRLFAKRMCVAQHLGPSQCPRYCSLLSVAFYFSTGTPTPPPSRVCLFQ